MAEFKCPICRDILDRSKTGTSIEFFCNECGFNDKGPAGYDSSKAYQWINRYNKQESQDSKTGVGFPTKRKKRRIKKPRSEKLEKDKKIIKNAEQIYEKLEKKSIPKPLIDTIRDPGHFPVYYNKLPKSMPELGDDLDQSIKITALRKKLNKKNIDRLYAYQEIVSDEIKNGNNVVISAPTGLGKTEAFLLPILESILLIEPNPSKRKGAIALLVYPTKALAADQREKIEYYCNNIGLTVAVYDGDTPRKERQSIYRNPPDLLITNADMIHYHLTGNQTFQILVTRVKYLVLDEIHLCIGAYGTNVLWIIRRLRRFSPGIQCIGASATISNAKNFGETIFDQPVKLISLGTARKSDMHLTMLYPKERSNLSVMSRVTENFVKAGNRTLTFGNGHLSAESLNIMLQSRGIRSEIHRAGLPLNHRARVEANFKNNKLDVIVSTPTLELGIDIGTLDSVVSMLTGLTSFVQRIGRAGRQGQDSYATMVLRGDDPISAYYARNPNDYLTYLDPAYVEPDNPHVARYQFLAMLLDRKLRIDEAAKYNRYLEPLLEENIVVISKGFVKLKNRKYAMDLLKNYSIRGIGEAVSIWNLNRQIGERSLPMALSELHPGAIYLHGGNSYKVMSFNERLQTSKVSKIRSKNERTQALRGISPRIDNIDSEDTISGLSAAYCELELTETVHGYIKKDIFTNKILGKHNLDNPISYKFKTMGFLLSLPRPEDFVSHLSHKERQDVLGGTFHAIEHVLIESGNSFSGGGANQIGGIAMGDTGFIFVYDGTEGGSGLSKLLYDSLDKGINRALNIMKDCPCNRRDGCPRCTYSYYCGNNNQPLDRIGAIKALQRYGKDATELEYNFDGVETFVIDPF